jgi:hypothetical protein
MSIQKRTSCEENSEKGIAIAKNFRLCANGGSGGRLPLTLSD